MPIIQISPAENEGPFAEGSGLATTLQPLRIEPVATVRKRRHSALVGSLELWLVANGIRRLIVSGVRTEQCCETTTRHASNLGYAVDYVGEATLTFAMVNAAGHTRSPAAIRALTEAGAGGAVRPHRDGRASACRVRGKTRCMSAPLESTRVIPVVTVVPPRVLLLDIAGPVEVLRTANLEQAAVRFTVAYVGPRSVSGSSIELGLTGVTPLPDALPADALVPVRGTTDVAISEGETDREDDAASETAIVEWLAGTVRPGMQLASICSGALLAVRAGLLDGQECTRHHDIVAELVRAAPRARVVENSIFVDNGERLTSAGVTAGVDLMLHIIAAHSTQL